ncbi:ankyrin repeat domain-containing protein [Pokkaliibacter sp. CJK22405]|uniref:ankyrin repeat domain-containing protein n=1 Tax=Pokkaliibacter sp. CJK22405 TaxID=3384615 RepID=UPI003984D079
MLGNRLGHVFIPTSAYQNTQLPNQGQPSSAAHQQNGKLYYNPGAINPYTRQMLSPRDFSRSYEFHAFKSQYHGQIEEVAGHLFEHSEPAKKWKQEFTAKVQSQSFSRNVGVSTHQLLEEASQQFHKLDRERKPIPEWLRAASTLRDLKTRLFDFRSDGKNPHYPTDDELALAYNGVKKELEKFSEMLGQPGFTAEHKAQSTIEVGIAAGKCAAGLEEECQQQQANLRSSSASLPLKVANTRDRMALQHLEGVAKGFGIREGVLRHAAVALYNQVRHQNGLGPLVGEEGNWSTSMERFQRKGHHIPSVISSANKSLNEALTATAIVGQLATEGFQTMRSIVASLPSAQGKLDKPIDEMEMYSIGQELFKNKEYNQLKESYGKDFDLPLELLFKKDSDDNYHFTGNPMKFELKMMQFMFDNNMGVDTLPKPVMSRVYNDESGIPVRQTVARWDDLMFVAENYGSKKGQPAPAFDFRTSDHELLDAKVLNQFSTRELQQNAPYQYTYNSAHQNQTHQIELARGVMKQAMQNTDINDLLELRPSWFQWMQMKKEDQPTLSLAINQIDEKTKGPERLINASRLLTQLDPRGHYSVLEDSALQRLMARSKPEDFIDPFQENELSPFLQRGQATLDPITLIDLLRQKESFPPGKQGLELIQAMKRSCNYSEPFPAISEPMKAAQSYILSNMSPKDALALPPELMRDLPLSVLAAGSKQLMLEQRQPWLMHAAAQWQLSQSQPVSVNDVLDATIQHVPADGQTIYCKNLLNHFNATKSERVNAALKHESMELLFDTLVTRPEAKKSKHSLHFSFRNKDEHQKLLSAARKYKDEATGESIMHIAARMGNAEAIREFADSDMAARRDFKGNTPLMNAIANHHGPATQALLAGDSQKLNKPISMKFQNFPHLAATYGQAYGSRMDVTPLTWALMHNNNAAVAQLISQGADTVRTDTSPSPFDIVVKSGNVEGMHYLTQGRHPNAQRDSLNHLLNTTQNNSPNRVQLAQVLMSNGAFADINMMKRAENSGDMHMLRSMIPHSSPVTLNSFDYQGNSLLMNAIGRNDLETTMLLLQHGADPQARNMYGRNVFNMQMSADMYELLQQREAFRQYEPAHMRFQ